MKNLDESYKTPLEIIKFKNKLKVFNKNIINVDITNIKQKTENNRNDVYQLFDELQKLGKIPLSEKKERTVLVSLASYVEKSKKEVFTPRSKATETQSETKIINTKDKTTETLITNSMILNSTKHYQIRFIKIAKLLIFMILLTVVSLSLANISTTINDFNNFNNINIISNSIVLKFSIISQLYNYVRMTIFNGNKLSNSNETYDTILTEMDNINQNYMIFINQYSEELVSSYTFYHQIKSNLNSENENLTNIPELIGLNSKGIDSAIETTVYTVRNIYSDYLGKDNITKNDIIEYFNKDITSLVNLEVEYVFDSINNEFTSRLHDDVYTFMENINDLIILLGTISLVSNIIIVIYLIFGFLAMLKHYLGVLNYSCKKFNGALYPGCK
jgi:hypothetical protein